MSAKEERIDKQYYVTNRDEFQLNKQSTLEMIENAEDFLVEIKLILENTQSDKMKTYRTKLLELMIIP
jgi:L-lactate utilization protein LutC